MINEENEVDDNKTDDTTNDEERKTKLLVRFPTDKRLAKQPRAERKLPVDFLICFSIVTNNKNCGLYVIFKSAIQPRRRAKIKQLIVRLEFEKRISLRLLFS